MTAMTVLWTELAKSGAVGAEGVRAFMEKRMKDIPTFGGEMNEETLQRLASMWAGATPDFAKFMGPMMQGWTSSSSGQGTPPWGELLSSPGFGLTRQYQTKVNKAFGAWMKYQQFDLDYRRLLSGAWTKSFTLVMESMAKQAAENPSAQTPRAFLEAWIRVADEVFVDLFRTEKFSKTQSSMVNALMELKRHRRALMEDVLVANDLPTRREVDEAHRMIYTLRKELKQVKRELAALKRQTGEVE